MPSARASGLEVWKFGGASLADAPAITQRGRAHRRTIPVRSSSWPRRSRGVTDALLDGARQAVAGDAQADGARGGRVPARVTRDVVARPVRPRARSRRALDEAIDAAAREYRRTLRGGRRARPPRRRARATCSFPAASGCRRSSSPRRSRPAGTQGRAASTRSSSSRPTASTATPRRIWPTRRAARARGSGRLLADAARAGRARFHRTRARRHA